MSVNIATSDAASAADGTYTIEITRPRHADLQLGLWTTHDETEQQFVVFSDRGCRKAFLLADVSGRPAYTCVDLRTLDIDAYHVAEVEICADTSAPRKSGHASIGKLNVRHGRGFITTIDEEGKPLDVQIAALHLAVEDGEYGFNWWLADRQFNYKNAEHGSVLHQAFPFNSWLNEWQSPYAN